MYLPLFIEMEGKKVLVVGGGEVALRRAKTVLEAGAEVTLIAPQREPGWEELSVQWRKEKYEDQPVEGYDLVIIATDNSAVNETLNRRCKEKNIPVNDATRGREGTVIFPGVVRSGGFTAAVTSEGKTPFLTRKVKGAIAALLSEYNEDLLRLLSETRSYIIENYPREKETLLRKLAKVPARQIREKGDRYAITDWLQREQTGINSDQTD